MDLVSYKYKIVYEKLGMIDNLIQSYLKLWV